MRIVQLVHDFLPEHVGGTEVHTFQLARALAARGHDVTILCTEHTGAWNGAASGSARASDPAPGTIRERAHEGLRVLELAHPREWPHARASWEEPLGAEALARLLPELSPEVVHAQHTFFFGARALELARRAGAATVLTLHDFHPLCARATLSDAAGELCDARRAEECARCLEHLPLDPARARADADAASARRAAQAERIAFHRAALAWAERVIVPSRTLATIVRDARLVPDERIVRLDLGCPGEVRAPRTRAPEQPLRAGFLGGIFPAKGVHVLVEAMRHLAGEPLELDVHGPLEWFPDYAASLRAGAEHLPVRFHGRYAPREVDAILAELDVLVLPSLWLENRPLVLAEARRNGLAVVATDLGGMREAIRHEIDGLLFPRGDARALAEALRRLARDRTLLARLAAARPDPVPMSRIADDVVALYRSLR